MKPDELAHVLRDLAERVERLRPLNHDPELYFVSRDEIRADMQKLADSLSPRRPPFQNPKAVFVGSDAYVAGRRVVVCRRGSRQ